MWLLPSLCAAAAAAAFPSPMLGSGPAGGNAGSAEGRGSPGRPREETLRGRLSERSGLTPPRRCRQSQGRPRADWRPRRQHPPPAARGRSARGQDPRPPLPALQLTAGFLRTLPPRASRPGSG